MEIGFSLDECLMMPFGYLLTFINIHSLKHNPNIREKAVEEDEFVRIMRG